MLILLTHANHLYSDRKQVRKMQPYPPLQTLMAAAALRAEGLSVAVVDTTFSKTVGEEIARLRPDLVAVCEDNFNYLTKMCLLQNREFAFEIAGLAREFGIPAVVNSSDAADRAAEYLNAGFDRIIVGELEASLLDLCRRWPEHVEGTAFSDAKAVHYTPPRPPIADLDSLPAPAWDLVDFEPYRSAWTAAHGFFSVNLVSSRGCPYRCNWCAKPVFGTTYRYRSPRVVAEEMALLKARVRPDQIWFADDIFALSGKWALQFAEEVGTREAQVPFKMQSRCDLMTRDTVQALRRAGCAEVWMGAESGAQPILDAMEKGIRVEHVYEARQNLAAHGIRACMFLQFGYPGETWNEIEQTIRMVRETRPDDVGISVSYPLPKTRFYDLVSAQIGPKTNWSDSDDLTMMFRGAYSTEFYQALTEALHSEVRGAAPQDQLQRKWDKVEQLRCAYC